MRRCAEQLLEVATEIRWTFLAHALLRARRVHVLAEHQAARLMEPYLFLELQGAHRRHRLEVVKKSGDAHPEMMRDALDFQRLVEMFDQVLDSP